MSDSRSGAERPSAQNPLREGLRVERAAEACTIVIFGASGDLTKRKLMPGLYSLYQQNLLGGACAIVGCGSSCSMQCSGSGACAQRRGFGLLGVLR